MEPWSAPGRLLRHGGAAFQLYLTDGDYLTVHDGVRSRWRFHEFVIGDLLPVEAVLARGGPGRDALRRGMGTEWRPPPFDEERPPPSQLSNAEVADWADRLSGEDEEFDDDEFDDDEGTTRALVWSRWSAALSTATPSSSGTATST